MYTTGTGAKPRRKPATYGKASRRIQQSYHDISSDKVEEYYEGDDNGDSQKIISQDRRVGPPQMRKVQTETPQASIGAPNPEVVTREIHEGSTTPGSTATPSTASPQNNNIYDVPSSDDASASSLELQINGARKRRKVDSVRTKELSVAVWDDASLQQHIAAEMGEAAPRLISFLDSQSSAIFQSSKSTAKSSGKATGRLKAQSKISSTHPAGGKTAKAAKEAPSPAGTDQSHPPILHPHLPVFQHVSKVQSRSTNLPLVKAVPDSLVTNKGTRRRPTTLAPDLGTFPIGAVVPRTPKKTFVSANNLAASREAPIPPFKDGVRLFSPGQMNLVGLNIKPCDSGQQQAAAGGLNSCLGHRLPVSTTPRTKLKDRLHGGSKPAQWSKENRDDDRDDDSDARSSILPIQGIPVKQELRRNEAKASRSISREKSQQQPCSNHVSRIQNGGPKITYSRQRSYLTENVANEADMLTLSDIGSQETNTARSRTRLYPPKLQTIQSIAEESDEAPDPQACAPKSIHELREAGTNARLLRDIEAILDDIDSGISVPLAVKRSGLLDIATKLQQPESCRLCLDHGLETRLFTQLGQDTDAVANILLIAAILPIVASSSSSQILSQLLDPRVVDFLGRQLQNARDLVSMVRCRELKLSTVLQADISSFCTSLLGSSAWRHGRPTQITGRVVSLQCLEYLVRHLREAGSMSSLLPQTVVERLVDILALSQGASSESNKNHLTDTQLALSILESSTIVQPVSSDDEHLPWSIQSIEKMETFLTFMQESSGEDLNGLQTLALRLCLNLTNNSRPCCKAFATPRMIYTSSSLIETCFQSLSAGLTGEPQAMTIDILVLSLGLLINLAEWSQSSRELYATKHEAGLSPLEKLSRLFQVNLARASDV